MTEGTVTRGVIFHQREGRDDEGLLALFNEECFLYNVSVRVPFTSCEEMRLWLDGVAAAQRFEIVAVLSGEIVGFGGLYILGDGQSHSAWLMLGVREAAQGRGVGSSLMHILIATAKIFVGLQRLQLTVFSDNEAGIALYHKFGFIIEGRHRHFARRGDDFVDAFTMARLFDEGEAGELDVTALQRLGLARAAA